MKFRGGAFSAVLLSAVLFSPAALAELAYTVTSLNVRAGPGAGYPLVATLPGGYAVDIRACSGSWCSVRAAGITGWTSARYLSVGGAPAPAPSYSTSTVIIGGGVDPFWDDDDPFFWGPPPAWGPPPYWHRHRPWGGPFWGGPRWPAGPRWGRPTYGGPGPVRPPWQRPHWGGGSPSSPTGRHGR
ncbi:SH3 domain-containing protein [Brucella sp. IR073]|uniref:SH3 domain-containing protein n=1 Tax=unclassified Brucella TaxID=2632610 RepID=UPI003B986F17